MRFFRVFIVFNIQMGTYYSPTSYKKLTMKAQVNNVYKTSSFVLYKIGKIRQFLTKEATKQLVHALVISRIDFCNSLLYSLPDVHTNKLQRIQNSAARLITETKRREHITPIFKQLHWLPVKSRINYKILLLTYQCLNGTAPSYLQDLIVQYTPTRKLRSNSKSLLVAPSTQTKYYGTRSFTNSSAELWNSLPDIVKQASTTESFKTLLKTYLFVNCKLVQTV